MTEKQRKELDELKADVLGMLQDRIEDIFIDLQNSMGIESGDVEPIDSWFIDKKENELAEMIANILVKQKGA